MSLREKLLAAVAFDEEATFQVSLGYDQKCKTLPPTTQARRHGYNDGAREHHARLTPLLTLLIDCAVALEGAVCECKHTYPTTCNECKALTSLRSLCGEMDPLDKIRAALERAVGK